MESASIAALLHATILPMNPLGHTPHASIDSAPSLSRQRPGSDDTAFFERLFVQSFAALPTHAALWMQCIGGENLRILRDGDARVGGLGIYRFGQWFGGRSVPCAGIAGVGIV